jgi:formiminoglutamase
VNFDAFVPSEVRPPQTAADDPRIGHLISTDRNRAPQAYLIGFPTDEGVRRNGGRVGARLAPDAIRSALFRMTPDVFRLEAMSALLSHTVDIGNLSVSDDLERDQETLGRFVGDCLQSDIVPIILGGGHETAFGHFLGYVAAKRDVAIVNFDAHADVRELKDGCGHSGSPFRQAMLHPSRRCVSYAVAGLLPWSVSLAHLAFIHEYNGRFLWSQDVTFDAVEALLRTSGDHVMATFDIDAVDQSHAPGVSAPGVGGLNVTRWLHAAYHAGLSPHVTSVDLVEVNPTLDFDAQTARLAALTLWHFLKGLAERTHPPI